MTDFKHAEISEFLDAELASLKTRIEAALSQFLASATEVAADRGRADSGFAALPVRKSTTKLAWEDLVVSSDTLTGLHGIREWFSVQDDLRKASGNLGIAPGYVAVFQGPSGSGKALAATLLGKGLDTSVYCLDAADVLGSARADVLAELNRFFGEAARQGWILYLDNAEDLLSAGTGDSRAALWAGIERHPGVAILGSSSNGPFPELRRRRIQSRVRFAGLGYEERRRLWADMVMRGLNPLNERGATLDPTADVGQLLHHDLRPGEIAGVVRNLAQRFLTNDRKSLTADDFEDAIERQYSLRGDA